MPRMPMVRTLSIALIGLSLLATSPFSRDIALGQIPQPTLQTMVLPASDVDPAADADSAPHFVAIDRGVASRGQLFLFLPGSSSRPDESTFLVRKAAESGFLAIGLSYPTSVEPNTLCVTRIDQDCPEKVRLTMLDGRTRTDFLQVARANSIEGRLAALLLYLDTHFPYAGWSVFLDGQLPRWSSIRLGGHSTGGSQAALVARTHEMARLCLLEAPIDGATTTGGGRTVPAWMNQNGATPIDRYYGFRHRESDPSRAGVLSAAWNAFGLDSLGPEVDVESIPFPYLGSHRLTTGAVPADLEGIPTQALAHASVAVDRATPRDDAGQPLFAAMWQHACFGD